jgi:hypothetical protein
MVYAQDLKSCVTIVTCGFESRPRHRSVAQLVSKAWPTDYLYRSVAQLVSNAWPTDYLYRSVAQLVERRVWDAEVPGSNPGTPTRAG